MTLLTKDNTKVGTKIRYIEPTWPDWYRKRNSLYGIVMGIQKENPNSPSMLTVAFYSNSEYNCPIASERWLTSRFILEDRLDAIVEDISRSKLERKCRKLWNNSNYVLKNPEKAY